MGKATVALLSLIGVCFLAWGIGIAIGIWSNPIFASFWILSNDMAHNVFFYVSSATGALLIVSSSLFYIRNSDKAEKETSPASGVIDPTKTVQWYNVPSRKFGAVSPSRTFKLAGPEFYKEEDWQKQQDLAQEAEVKNIEYHPFINLNGTIPKKTQKPRINRESKAP